jgi:hypothetical protein
MVVITVVFLLLLVAFLSTGVYYTTRAPERHDLQ